MVAFFLLPLLTQAQEEEPVEQYLNEYLILAAENNPELKALFNEYLAALEQVPQVGTLPDPQLMFGYFVRSMNGQRFNASLSQMFPWFGTLEAQKEVAAQRAKAKLQIFEDAKLELFKEIKVTYNDLYYLQAAVEITEENLKLLESFKGLAEVSFESGKAGFSSVLQVQIEEEDLRSRLDYLQDSRQPLLTEFEQLLNVNMEEPVNLPDTLWEEPLLLEKEEIFNTILAENPQLEQLRYEERALKEEVEVARKMGLPSISLGLSYTNVGPAENVDMPGSGQDMFTFPQLGIRLPIYRKKYKAMKKEALLQREAVEFRKENLENVLLTELEQLYRDYLDAQRKVELYSRLTTLAEQSLRLLQTELATGQNDLFELIRMERQLLDYRLELERARTEKNNNVYRINYLMGEKYEQDR